MWVRSDVTSGRNRRWEWRPDAGDAEDGKTRSDASGCGPRASDAGLTFADDEYRTHRTHWTPSPHYESQDATPEYLTQDGFLLMRYLVYKVRENLLYLPEVLSHDLRS